MIYRKYRLVGVSCVALMGYMISCSQPPQINNTSHDSKDSTLTVTPIYSDTAFSDGGSVKISLSNEKIIAHWSYNNVSHEARIDSLVPEEEPIRIGGWSFFEGMFYYGVRFHQDGVFFRDILLPKLSGNEIRSFRNPLCYDDNVSTVAFVAAFDPIIVIGIEKIRQQKDKYYDLCPRDQWVNGIYDRPEEAIFKGDELILKWIDIQGVRHLKVLSGS